jgi:stearoyl-CoA desaturase (delta-9 desaturase)
MKKINWLFVFQIIAHLSVVPMIMYGSWYHWAIAISVYFVTGSIGMSGTYHRLLSHKSYAAPRWWQIFGTVAATLGGTGSSIAWVAVHRAHHRFTDTSQDPHCPHHHGVFRVQFLSMFYQPNIKYVPDLLRDSFHVAMHKYYWAVHATFATVLFAVDPFAVIYAWLVPSVILWHAGSGVNTLGHMWGWQDHNAGKDSSTNHPVLGVLMWGEGWHNNHHADPGNWEFGRKWWQIDVTKQIIKLVKQ